MSPENNHPAAKVFQDVEIHFKIKSNYFIIISVLLHDIDLFLFLCTTNRPYLKNWGGLLKGERVGGGHLKHLQ